MIAALAVAALFAVSQANAAEPAVTIKAYKVVCDDETDLPNWGTTGAQKPLMIDVSTAANYVTDSEGKCRMASGWEFEWGFNVTSPTRDLIGSGGAGWNAFDSVTGCGPAQATISASVLGQKSEIRVKENLQAGYLPFAGDASGGLQNDVSAEFYCHNDILNYDNYDFIRGAAVDNTYYCVAFNVLIAQEDPAIDGECGPAAKVYPYYATDFDGALCAVGNTGENQWEFPGPGGSVTWICYGENGGENEECTATRETESTPVEPIDGVCGTAADDYAYNATGFNGDFCAAGNMQEGGADFPAQGGLVTWTCYGVGEGKNVGENATCTATRASAPSQQSSSTSGSSSGQYMPGYGPSAGGVAPQVLGAGIDLDEIARQIEEIRQKIAGIAGQINKGVLGAATEVATGACGADLDNDGNSWFAGSSSFGANPWLSRLRAQLCR